MSLGFAQGAMALVYKIVNKCLRLTGGTMTGDLNMTADIIPTADGSYDLGSAAKRWAEVHADTVELDSAADIEWASRGKILSPGDAVFQFLNNAANAGVRLNSSSNSWHLQTRSGSADAQLKVITSYHYNDAQYGGGEFRALYTLQTTDATQTNIATQGVGEGECWIMEGFVIGIKSDASQAACYRVHQAFRRAAAGNVTKVGTGEVNADEDDATWDCDTNANAGTQQGEIRVTGKAATTIDWKIALRVMRVA